MHQHLPHQPTKRRFPLSLLIPEESIRSQHRQQVLIPDEGELNPREQLKDLDDRPHHFGFD
jgi:hypothetical protein